MRKPFTMVELGKIAEKGCSHVGCKDPRCGAEFYLHSTCHPQSAAWVRYEKSGTLVVLCGVCRKEIVRMQIAGGSADAPASVAAPAAVVAQRPRWQQVSYEAGQRAFAEMLSQTASEGIWFTQSQQECARLACLVAASTMGRLLADRPDAAELLDEAKKESPGS